MDKRSILLGIVCGLAVVGIVLAFTLGCLFLLATVKLHTGSMFLLGAIAVALFTTLVKSGATSLGQYIILVVVEKFNDQPEEFTTAMWTTFFAGFIAMILGFKFFG